MGGEYGETHQTYELRGGRLIIVLNGFHFYPIPTVLVDSLSTKLASQPRMTLFFAVV